MAKTEFKKYKLIYNDELVGYFNTPLNIDASETKQLLQAVIDNVSIEDAVSKPKGSKLLELIGKKDTSSKSETF